MRRTFERADDLVVAMEARAYTEHCTDPHLAAASGDWIFLIVVCCLGVSLFFLP